MNTKQKKALVAGIAIAVLIGLFPPWTDTFALPGLSTTQKSAGYSFLLSPPTAPQQLALGGTLDVAPYHTFTIDFSRLLVQWVVVALGTWCGCVYFREPAKK